MIPLLYRVGRAAPEREGGREGSSGDHGSSIMDNGDNCAALKTLLLKQAGGTAQQQGLAQCGALNEKTSQWFISYQGVELFE